LGAGAASTFSSDFFAGAASLPSPSAGLSARPPRRAAVATPAAPIAAAPAGPGTGTPSTRTLSKRMLPLPLVAFSTFRRSRAMPLFSTVNSDRLN